MYKIRHLNYSTSSVLSGIKSFEKHRITTMGGWRSKSWDRFATFTFLYTKIPMLPQHDSPPPLVMKMTFCGSHPRIQCATSLDIFMTTLPPQLLLALSCTVMPRQSLLPLPVPRHLPRPCPPHFMSTKASQLCHRLTTINMLQSHSTPPIRQPLKAPPFLPLPRLQSPPG